MSKARWFLYGVIASISISVASAASYFVSPGPFINPLTTLGDWVYGGTNGALTRLAGNTTASPQIPCQTGNGSVSAAPTLCSTTGTGNVVMSSSPTIAAPTLSGTTTASTVNGSGFNATSFIALSGATGFLADATSTVTNITGSTYTATNVWHTIDSDGSTNASLTVTMYATPANNQMWCFANPAGAITLLTISPNSGQTILGAPSAVAAAIGSSYCFLYKTSGTTWYRIQ